MTQLKRKRNGVCGPSILPALRSNNNHKRLSRATLLSARHYSHLTNEGNGTLRGQATCPRSHHKRRWQDFDANKDLCEAKLCWEPVLGGDNNKVND